MRDQFPNYQFGRCLRLILGAAFLLALTCGAPAWAETVPSGRVVMITLDGFSWGDYDEAVLPSLSFVVKSGAIGCTNVRSADRVDSLGAFVGFGADKRATGLSGGGVAFESEELVGTLTTADSRFFPSSFPESEMAGDIFRRRTGRTAPSGGGVHLMIEPLRNSNLASDFGARVGLLGELLNASGFATAVIGSSDTDTVRRPAFTAAMDETGRVPFAVIDGVVVYDPKAPFGKRTDVGAALRAFDELCGRASYVVVDWGDIYRAERFGEVATDSAAQREQLKALESLDSFIGLVTRRLSDDDLLIICSVSNGRDYESRGFKLTPLIVKGPGFPPGLLSSESTRRRGIITLLDIPVSVAAFFGIAAPDFTGQPLYSVPGDSPLHYLRSEERKIVDIDRLRAPVLKGYVFFQALILLLIAAAAFWRDLLKRWNGGLRVGLLVSMAIPLFLLITPALPTAVIWQAALAFILAVTLAVFLSLVVSTPLTRLLVLSVLTVFSLTADSLLGGHLIQDSLLGYSATVGARFYGVGNEYMGVLIGSALMLAAIIMERSTVPFPRLWVSFLHGGVVLLLAAPQFGANFGGTVTAVTAAFAFGVRLRKRLPLRTFLTLALGGALLFAGGFLVYSAYVESATHITSALRRALVGDWNEIGRIAYRKVIMNWTLIRYTVWTRVLLAGILAWGVIIFRCELKAGYFQRRYPWISKAMLPVFIASITAFVANDSGVVAAATILIFGLQVPIYLVLGEIPLHNPN